MPFDLEKVLAGDNYIYEHTFTEKPFDGLTIKYRQTPDNLIDLLVEEFGTRLAELGCPAANAFVRWVVNPGVKQGDDPFKTLSQDLLKWVKELTDTEVLTICSKLIPAAIIKHSLGSWNQTPPISTDIIAKLPAKLRVEINKLIGEANTGGIAPEKAAFLPK